MNDTQLYAAILGIQSPWHATQVDVRAVEEVVTVTVAPRAGASYSTCKLRHCLRAAD